MSLVQLVDTLLTLCVLIRSYEATSAREVKDGVELLGVGETELILHGELIFNVPSSCEHIRMCYLMSKNVRKSYNNKAIDCQPNSCLLRLKPSVSFYTGVLHPIIQGDTAIVTFNDKDKEYCPLQTLTGSQTFQIVQMSVGCPITVVGATLPKPKEEEVEQSEEEEKASSEQPVHKSNNLWIIPVIVVVAVICVLATGAHVYIIHRCYKVRKSENADLPVHSIKQPPNAASKSPAPTSPATLPPQTPPATSTPQPLETEPVSPSVAKPSREVEKAKRKAKKHRKSQITTVTEPMKSVTANDVSPPFEMAAKLTEDAARNLHRNEMLTYHGMIPCRSGSQLDPFLQNIYEIYEPFPARRKIVDWELKFFLQIVSDAFRELPWLLKNARLQLSSHGAVYSHGRYCSFTRRTGKFISRCTTPGFIAWYAFATKYGGEIRIPDDERFDVILKRLSVPALLVVVFRENIEIETRRSAYRRIRQLMIQINSMYPKMQLRGMPYPACLIPALIEKDSRAFFEGANDLSYSTPIEVINQIKKYEDSEAEERTDETQPTFSDGKKRDVLGSVEVLGTQTTATTTV